MLAAVLATAASLSAAAAPPHTWHFGWYSILDVGAGRAFSFHAIRASRGCDKAVFPRLVQL